MNEYRDSGRPDNSSSSGEYDFTDYPPTRECEQCGDRKLTRGDSGPGEGVSKCPDCDGWYCDPQCMTGTRCKPCALDAEAVAAEAARLEQQIESDREKELRTLKLNNPV